MTTLIRDAQGGFQLPQTLRQGQNFTDPMGRTGVVNFDSATGKPLAPGATTYDRPMGSAPAYSDLTSSNTSGGGYIPPQLKNNTNSTTSFTTALIQMLKEAQGADTAGQARLMKQSQGITGQGLNDTERIFSNKRLAPSSGTSLGMSAQSQFDPLQLSIANQQKLASQNLGNITDLVKQTSYDYQNEQDRIARAEENRLDRIASAAKASSNVTFDTQGAISKFSNLMKSITGKAKGEPNGDNYIDPQEWISARELWATQGGSDSSFVSNFKRYLNPLSYQLAGIKTTQTEDEKMQELVDSIFQ